MNLVRVLAILASFQSVLSQILGDDGLGPGPGAWERDSPENHGLSSRKLKDAGKKVRTSIPFRYCFVVVKDGKVVHEDYYSSSEEKKHTPFSLGKTMASLLTGVAVTQGKLDLDKPIADYGVKTSAFKKFGSNVTTRHILGQNSGEGEYTPGTKFMYNSGKYIDHISKVIGEAVGEDTAKFGQRELLAKLGVDEEFWSTRGDIRVGVGGPVTCLDLARMGQIMLNKGKWKNAAGQVEQVVSEDYIAQQTSPAYRSSNTAYGFLTWLNTPTKKPEFWTGATCYDNSTRYGDPFANGGKSKAPADAFTGMGATGQYVTVLPSQNTVVVTMGASYGSSKECRSYDSHDILRRFTEAHIPATYN